MISNIVMTTIITTAMMTEMQYTYYIYSLL